MGVFKMKMITDSDTLFMTTDSQAKIDEAKIKKMFNTEKLLADNYFIHQAPDLATWAEINFMHKDLNANLLKKEYLSEIKNINDYMLENVNFKINDTETINYYKVCAQRNKNCVIEGYNLMFNKFYEWLKESVEKISNGTMSDDLNWYISRNKNSINITSLKINLGK